MTSFRYFYTTVLICFLCQPLLAHAWQLEAGLVSTNDTTITSSFTSVTFQQAFDVVPIVVALPTDEDNAPADDPAILRIRNVTTTGFEISAIEPEGSNGPHGSMTVHYTAIEPGVHTLPDGTKVAAGSHPTSTIQSKFLSPTGFDTVPFGTTLVSSASVVAALQTTNSEIGISPSAPSIPFMTVATLNPSMTSIQLALDRGETTSGTVVTEDVGWIAFPAGQSGDFLDITNATIGWDARTTADTIVGHGNGCTTHTFTATNWPNARILGSKNRRDGPDGGWLRRCSLSGTMIGLIIDEDTAVDSERNHTSESAALLSFSDSFHANFEGKIQAEKNVSTSLGTYALPGNTVTYTISIDSTGIYPIDSGSVVLTDALPSEIKFKIADLDGSGSGPVKFEDGSPTSGLSYSFLGLANMTDDLDFSNDGGVSFGYVPTDDGSGSDSNVTHIRMSPKGTFLARSAAGNPNFEFIFDAIIK